MDRERRILSEIETRTPRRRPLARRVLTICQALVLIGASMAVIASFWGTSLRAGGEALARGADTAAATAGLHVARILTPDLDGKRRQAVLAASGIELGSNIFRADPHRIRERLERIDGVGSAHVSRIWPDTIVIAVQPRRAAALMGDGTEWAVLDAAGHPIAGADPAEYRDLPRLFGAETPEVVASLLAALRTHPSLRERLRLAERVAGRRWDLHLTSGARLALPESDWRIRLVSLRVLHEKYHLFDLDLGRIDARLSHQIAVTLPGDSLPAGRGA